MRAWGDDDIVEFIRGAREKWKVPDPKEVMELLALSLVEYEQQRKQAAKELGIRVTALDGMVERERASARRHEEVDEEIAEINADHALVLAGNKAAVMKFEEPDQVSAVAGRRVQAVVCQSDGHDRQGS